MPTAAQQAPPATLIAGDAAVGTRHIGHGPRHTEELPVGGSQVGLGADPRLVALVKFGSVRPARITALAHHSLVNDETVQRTEPNTRSPVGQIPAQFLNRRFGPVGHHSDDLPNMLFHLA